MMLEAICWLQLMKHFGLVVPVRGKEETYIVQSADGEETHWPRQAALHAGTLKDWVDTTGGEGKFPTPLSAAARRIR